MLTEKDAMKRMIKVGPNLSEVLKVKVFRKIDLKGLEEQVGETPYVPEER